MAIFGPTFWEGTLGHGASKKTYANNP